MQHILESLMPNETVVIETTSGKLEPMTPVELAIMLNNDNDNAGDVICASAMSDGDKPRNVWSRQYGDNSEQSMRNASLVLTMLDVSYLMDEKNSHAIMSSLKQSRSKGLSMLKMLNAALMSIDSPFTLESAAQGYFDVNVRLTGTAIHRVCVFWKFNIFSLGNIYYSNRKTSGQFNLDLKTTIDKLVKNNTELTV